MCFSIPFACHLKKVQMQEQLLDALNVLDEDALVTITELNTKVRARPTY